MRQQREQRHADERAGAQKSAEQSQRFAPPWTWSLSPSSRGPPPPNTVLLSRYSSTVETSITTTSANGKWIARDLLDAIENLHARDAREIENQRHAEFGEGEDEDDRAARKQARHDERKRDAAEAAEAGAAEVLRCLPSPGPRSRARRRMFRKRMG